MSRLLPHFALLLLSILLTGCSGSLFLGDDGPSANDDDGGDDVQPPDIDLSIFSGVEYLNIRWDPEMADDGRVDCQEAFVVDGAITDDEVAVVGGQLKIATPQPGFPVTMAKVRGSYEGYVEAWAEMSKMNPAPQDRLRLRMVLVRAVGEVETSDGHARAEQCFHRGQVCRLWTQGAHNLRAEGAFVEAGGI